MYSAQVAAGGGRDIAMKGRHERTKLQQTEVSELATVYAVRSLEEEKHKNTDHISFFFFFIKKHTG